MKTTCNASNILDSGITIKNLVSGSSKSLCNKNEKHAFWLSEVDNDKLRANIEGNPLIAPWEVVEEFNVDHSTVVQHLEQTGEMETPING